MRGARRLRCAGAALLLCVLPARADVLLIGHQHIGDEEGNTFTPADPVTRAQMRSNPSRFHLTQGTTITAVRFENAVSLGTQIAGIEFDRDGVLRTGTLSGNVFTLSSPRTLSAGTRSIFPDPGCLDGGGAAAACPASGENDIGFSALTLISAQASTSRNLNRRRHIGDDPEAINDNYGGDYYPDALDLLPTAIRADMPFSIDVARPLNLVQFYRLRGVNTAAGSHAQVLVNNQLVGVLAGSGDPLPVAANLSLPAGNHTLSVIAGSLDASNRDSISWDDGVLQFGSPLSGTPGEFNAVDTGFSATGGVIRTKIAGLAFSLDLVALNVSRTATEAAYQGTVAVELLDARDDSGGLDEFGCRSSWTLAASLGNQTFAAADAGRKSSTTQYDGALRVARVRVTDSARGLSGCSTDAFAIRPAGFDLRASDGGPAIPGTNLQLTTSGVNDVPTHRAGQPFTLRVRPFNAAGNVIFSDYDGTPTVLADAPLLGATLGTLSVGGWNAQNTSNGVVRSNTARYSEAGVVRLRVEDSSFADVDVTDGSSAAQRAITPGYSDVGRFTPDHFRLVSRAAQLAPACGTFSYEGQPMSFSTPPTVVLQAVDAAGNPTRNYTGSLFKLAALGPAAFSAVNGADPSLLSLTPTTVATLAQDQGSGQAALGFGGTTLTVVRNLARAPLDLEVELLVPGTDSDGVSYDDPLVPPPLRVGRAANGQGIAFDGGASQIRFGRLFVQNAYGSELLPLEVAFGTEYFAGGGFTRNLADSCTTAAAPALSGPLAALTAVEAITSPLLAGLGSLRLAVPSGATVGNLTLLMTPATWLLGDADNNGVHDNPVPAQATFGLARPGEQRIYLRETYR